jgi:hypothetical protein
VFRIHRDIILLATLGFPDRLVPERVPTEKPEIRILRQEAEMDPSVARRPVRFHKGIFVSVIALRLAVPPAQSLMKGISRVKHVERETDLLSQTNFQVNACKYISAPLRLHGVVSTCPVYRHTNSLSDVCYVRRH